MSRHFHPLNDAFARQENSFMIHFSDIVSTDLVQLYKGFSGAQNFQVDPRILWVRDIISDQMLVTGLGDEMCWRKLWDVGDGFGRFRHQYPLSFNIIVGHQHSKDVTNIEILLSTRKNCHQHKVANIDLSPTSMQPKC